MKKIRNKERRRDNEDGLKKEGKAEDGRHKHRKKEENG